MIVALLVPIHMAWTVPAEAYPPDNAAVLYYQAFMLYDASAEAKSMLDDYRQGLIGPDGKVEEYLADNKRIIDMVLDATQIEHCDWGLDYSQGTEVLLPPHHQARDIFFLIAAEARMQADKGDWKSGLEHCMAMYRMARHLNERPLICYIVGIAINAANHKCVTQILSAMPPETETLTWLQTELTHLDEQPFSIGPVLQWKRQAAIISMSPDRIVEAVETGLDDCDVKTRILERIRTADGPFYARNVAYWNDFMDQVEAAFEKSYDEAFATLGELDKKPCAALDTNPAASLTVCFAPTFQQIYALSIRLEAHSNALRTAVELYLARAREGRLPETLPADTLTDPFSNRPFAYTRTADGFVLRCRGEDLFKHMVHEYEFKVSQ